MTFLPLWQCAAPNEPAAAAAAFCEAYFLPVLSCKGVLEHAEYGCQTKLAAGGSSEWRMQFWLEETRRFSVHLGETAPPFIVEVQASEQDLAALALREGTGMGLGQDEIKHLERWLKAQLVGM